MSRAHFYRPIQDSEGNLIYDASVRVIDEDTDENFLGDLYVSAEGEEVRDNPFTAESGVADFYIEGSKQISLGVTPPGGEEGIIKDLSISTEVSVRETASFSASGVLMPKVYPYRYYLEESYRLLSIRASVGTPPEGDDLVVSLRVNGTELSPLDPAAKPRILDGGFTAIAEPEGFAFFEGDYLTIEVTQVGSSVAGSDLSVQIRMEQDATLTPEIN